MEDLKARGSDSEVAVNLAVYFFATILSFRATIVYLYLSFRERCDMIQ